MTKHTATHLDETHSSYWLDDSAGVFVDLNADEKDAPIERILKLAAVRRATSNFVRILTGDSTIEVKYSSGKDSYTDGKTVVISADERVENFDSMVGLALHEGSHCLLSDFGFLKLIRSNSVFYSALHPKLRKLFPMNIANTTEQEDAILNTLRTYIQLLMNVVEDRRIDSYVYKMAPGYRPYYDAMYAKYFFNKDMENNLRRNPEWRVPTIDNYINWLVCMFSPHFNPRAMRGLTKMVRTIDLPNIRRLDAKAVMPPYGMWAMNSDGTFEYEQFSPLWKVANELMIEILRHVQFEAMQNNKKQIDFGNIEIELDGFGEQEMQDMQLENLDPVENGRFSVDRGKKAIQKIKSELDGTRKKKKLTKNEKEQIDSMESAAAKISESSDPLLGRVPCFVTKSLNKQILRSDWFPFTHGYREWGKPDADPLKDSTSAAAVLDGIRMGAILAQRLSVRNDAMVTHFTRQPHGKIDRRILAQLGMDIESVFKRSTVDQFTPVLLYLSLDASGSMSGRKWKQVMTVAVALAYAAERIRNLDVVISLRGNGRGAGIPSVSVVYDSRTDKFNKVRELFPYLTCNGSTPEGLCYLATMDLMEECTKTHTTYFINFSDGEPGTSFRYNGQTFNYTGYAAHHQTRKMVKQIREMGIEVMSYFITDVYHVSPYGKSAFVTMYGQDAEFINVQNVTQVLKTLNKLLLKK
jgi:hypothetical protein